MTVTKMPKEAQLAMGRILRLASRPSKAGDIQEYFRCRDIIMANAPTLTDFAPNWVADKRKGAFPYGD